MKAVKLFVWVKNRAEEQQMGYLVLFCLQWTPSAGGPELLREISAGNYLCFQWQPLQPSTYSSM